MFMYRTLIVDDVMFNLLELERLDAWGEESNFIIANKARDGVEALARLRKDRYDLVITDIRMPKLDGIDLLKEIKKENLCACVALFSELGEFEYARSGMILGAFDYLIKPVKKSNMNALLKRARIFLDARRKIICDGIRNDASAGVIESGFFYPKTEEENIIALIECGSRDIPYLFKEAADSVERLLDGREALADDVIKKFYNNIIRATHERYPWLDLYVHQSNCKPHYTLTYGASEEERLNHGGAIIRYFQSLSELFHMIDRFVFIDTPHLIKDICDYILRNAESEISLQSIADRFGVNNTYLSNFFKQKTGIGFNEYLTTVKIERAKYYLVNTDMKVGCISYTLDYADADYFNRLFKRYVNMTPTAYRKQYIAGSARI
jgi:two-component system response regulator YesN